MSFRVGDHLSLIGADTGNRGNPAQGGKLPVLIWSFTFTVHFLDVGHRPADHLLWHL